jgi:hypothetical protein
LFKKPGGVAAAGGVWETNFAAWLRVFGFQCSVFSESQERVAERRDLALLISGGRADAAKSSSVFSQLPALFMISAHGDPTRLEACFEMRRRCEVDTEG